MLVLINNLIIMKNFSVTIGGIITALALPVVVGWGFSESCSQEIVGVGVPTLLSIPGLVVAWWGRYKTGGITALGTRKA